MNELTKLLISLTIRQRITIGLAAAAILAGLWGLARWNQERNFQPLYTSLSTEDAAAVVEKLRADKIEYRLDPTGGVIRVRSEAVAETRLRIAGAGLPKTGRIGFELFDGANFGLTEFAEQVNFRRALEGELERSIAALAEVERARVHISFPKDSVFLESRQEAKASVMLKLRSRARLSPQNGQAICHLVASAVDRLSPDHVTILDTAGNLLVRPRKAGLDGGLEGSEAGLEYKQKIERDLGLKIQSTLEPLLGAEGFRAGVSVDFDFAGGEESREVFDPNGSVVLTSQKSEDTGALAQPAGQPGTASNLPNPPATPPASLIGSSRKTESITYQPSKTVRHVRLPQGTIKRISLAVLVDQPMRWEGTGPKARRIFDAPSPEKLKSIRQLVAAATGFSEKRGDELIIESLPFESHLSADPPGSGTTLSVPRPGFLLNLPPWLEVYVQKMSPVLLVGIAVGILLTLLAPLIYLLLRLKRKGGRFDAVGAVAGGGDRASLEPLPSLEQQFATRKALKERLEAEALQALKLPPIETKKAEVLVKHLKDVAKKDPAAMAQLLRTWIHEADNG